jgi:hypothetical protein
MLFRWAWNKPRICAAVFGLEALSNEDWNIVTVGGRSDSVLGNSYVGRFDTAKAF